MRRKKANPLKKATNNQKLVIILGVLLFVTAIFVFKTQKPAAESLDSQERADAAPTAGENGSSQADVTLEAASVVTDTADAPLPTALSPTPPLLPEAQLDQYMAAGRPILAFFHSNTCAQCIRMTEVVNQVYPDYAQHIALVDVNVYDQQNQNLLDRAGIRVIPTLIFIDKKQQGQSYSGVMPAETLREQLKALAQEP